MAEIEGSTVTWEVSSDGGTTFVDLNGVKSGTPKLGRMKLDVTAFGDDFVKSIAGIKDTDLTFDYFINYSDAGQDALRASEASKSTVQIRLLLDGTNGWLFEGYIVSTTVKLDPKAPSEASTGLAMTAAPIVQS